MGRDFFVVLYFCYIFVSVFRGGRFFGVLGRVGVVF